MEVTLVWRRGGQEAEDLVVELQKALVDKAGVATEFAAAPLPGHRTTVRFTDGRSMEEAERRVRDTLDEVRPDWDQFLDLE